MKMAAARALLAGALLAGVEGLSPKGPQGQWDVAIQVRREWSPCFGTCLPPSLPACLPALRRRAGPAWPSRRRAARWGVGVAALAAQSGGRPERERRQGGRTCALSAATWRRKLVLQGHAAKGCSRWALGAERGGWRCSGWRCPAMGATAVLPLAAKYGTLTALPSLARRTRTAMAS